MIRHSMGRMKKGHQISKAMNSGETANPAWIHRGCGGVVYVRINGQQFACHNCHRSGQLELLTGKIPYVRRKMAQECSDVLTLVA